MAEFPALPIWTDAYLADCSHLTDAEHGIYLQLLMLMWRSPDCRIPDDDEWIARKLRRDANAVRTYIRPLMHEFCKIEDNYIIQKRLQKEWVWCREKREKNKSAAKSRWNNDSVTCKRISKRISKRNAPTPLPLPITTPTIIKDRLLPDWVPKNDWDDWISQRKKKPTKRAIELAIKKLEELKNKGHDPAKVLQYCIMNGYQGLFPPKGEKNATHIGSFNKEVRHRGDPATNAFNAAQSIIARRNAAAGLGASTEPAYDAFAADVCLPENLRRQSGNDGIP